MSNVWCFFVCNSRTPATPATFATPKPTLVRPKATTSGSTARKKVAPPSATPKRKGGTASTANLSDDSDVNEDDDAEFETPPKPGKTFNHFQMNHHHHQTHNHQPHQQQQQHHGLGSTSSNQTQRDFAPSAIGSGGFSSFASTTTTNQSLNSGSLYHLPSLSHPNGASIMSPSFSSIAQASALSSSQPTTSRMSKEKQQFFRHSAFNSDRPNKVSPPAATNNSRLGQTHLDITNSSTSDSDKSIDDKAAPKSNHKSTHKTDTLPNRICATNLSESSSSCSSSEDDDDDDSSSGTSSSSSSTNSTSSSTNSSSNSTDSEESGKTTTTAKSKKPPTPLPPASSDRSTGPPVTGNLHRKAAANSRSSSSNSIPIQSGGVGPIKFPSSSSATESAAASCSAWGFAAEAKKSVDIFRKTAEVANERVFGNFDGIDKDSLVVKTTTADHRNQLIGLNNNNNNKTTGQLKGLFDSLSHVFSTTDYTRARSNAPSTYKSIDRRRKPKEFTAPKEVLKETRSTFKDFKEQQRRMSTMGQKIGVPSPDFSSFQPPKQNLLSNRFSVGKSFFANKTSSNAFPNTHHHHSPTTHMMSVFKTQPNAGNVVARRRTTATASMSQKPVRSRYDSSSEDEVQHIFGANNPPRMTPSNLVKNAINCQSQQGRQHIRSQLFNGPAGGLNQGGSGVSRPNSPSSNGIGSPSGGGGAAAAAYPKPTSSYSQSQFMGKNALPKQPKSNDQKL